MDRLSLSLDLSGEPVLACHSRRRTGLAHPRYRLTDLIKSTGQQLPRKTTLLNITSFSGAPKVNANSCTSTLSRMRNGRPLTPAGRCRPLHASFQLTLGQLAVNTASHLNPVSKSKYIDYREIVIRRAARLRLMRGKCVGRSLAGLQGKVIPDKRHIRARQSLGKEIDSLPTEVVKKTPLTGWEQDQSTARLREDSMTPGRSGYNDPFFPI
jgi:hypothetical protein